MDQETLEIIATVDDEKLEHIGHTFTLRSGVVLSLRKVAPVMLQRALEALVAPEVPKVYIEDKETYEENPSDPDYLEAFRTYQIKRGTLMQEVSLAKGTEIKSLPEGVVGPDDDAWIADVEFLGINITNKDSKVARHLQWLYFQLVDIEELQALVLSAQAYNGLVSEEYVLKEMYFFRHPEKRGELNTSDDTEAPTDRRDVSEPTTRDSERVRAEGSSELRPVDLADLSETNGRRKDKVSSAL